MTGEGDGDWVKARRRAHAEREAAEAERLQDARERSAASEWTPADEEHLQAERAWFAKARADGVVTALLPVPDVLSDDPTKEYTMEPNETDRVSGARSAGSRGDFADYARSAAVTGVWSGSAAA